MVFPLTPTNNQLYLDPLNRVWKYTSSSKIWSFIDTSSSIDNIAATVAPTATDDSSKGYDVGSRWIDVTSNIPYICVDSTATAAVWIRSDQGSQFPQVTTNPATPTVGQTWFNTTTNAFQGNDGVVKTFTLV